MIFVIETLFGRGKDWAGSHPFLYGYPLAVGKGKPGVVSQK
jgi:hypothetical protein